MAAKRPADRKTHRWRLSRYGFTHCPNRREAELVVEQLSDGFEGELTIEKTGYPQPVRLDRRSTLRRAPRFIVRHTRGPVAESPRAV